MLSPKLQTWLEKQRLFFVATAPLSVDGHVNCSPKGADTFRILDGHRVAYVDFTGSGIETVAHAQENGRIVLMFCAFEGPPKIVRLHGLAEVVYPTDAAYGELSVHFHSNVATRAIVVVKVTRISDSCGFGVPLMDYVGERDVLEKWAESKGPAGLSEYRRDKNRESIDGIEGYKVPNKPPDPTLASGTTPAGQEPRHPPPQINRTLGGNMGLVLDTPRLSLRHLKPKDSAFLLELMNEAPYIANIGDRGVRTVADAMRYIEEKYTASYARHGFGLYLVELAVGRAPIGICGLVKRESLEHPDLGFAYLRRFWSMGYATEAAAATLKYARESLMLSYVYGVVSPMNSRSIRLLEHLGFRHVRALASTGQPLESHLYGKELKPA